MSPFADIPAQRDTEPAPSRRTRVLVTGAGGPAAVGVLRQLAAATDAELFAADCDPYAAGLYLVAAARRGLFPRGDDPAFVDAVAQVCRREAIDVLVPTVDSELLPLARVERGFASSGTRLLLADATTLAMCLDKWTLVQACAATVPVPRTAVLDGEFDTADWSWPVIVKPRRGSGSRGIWLVTNPAELADDPRTGETIVQEYLPGEEFSVDVLATRDGRAVAAVPRARLKTDSGVCVTGTTMHDAELERVALDVAAVVGLRYVANVQLRRDVTGTPRLLEVNPRFPGTMPLTVASGVDMPTLALRSLLGETLPDSVPFREVSVVRYLDDHFLDRDELLDRRVAPFGTSELPSPVLGAKSGAR